MSDRFYNLPIITHEPERKPDGWTRFIKVQKNDKNDMSEMTQVLRHLKSACEIIDAITKE